MARHEHTPKHEDNQQELLKERFESVGNVFLELATEEFTLGDNHRQLFASVPNVAYGANGDQINLGFVAGYKIVTEGSEHQKLSYIWVYRYDSQGIVKGPDSKHNYVKAFEFDEAFQQENYDPAKLDRDVTAVESDIDQLKTFQKMHPPIGPIQTL